MRRKHSDTRRSGADAAVGPASTYTVTAPETIDVVADLQLSEAIAEVIGARLVSRLPETARIVEQAFVDPVAR